MKRIFSTLLVAVMLVTALPFAAFPASAATSGYFTYTVTYGKATITDCSTSVSGALEIPATLGGYPVTSIGSYAFYDCDSLTSVTIGNSVTTINYGAFYDCDSLTSVIIGDSVSSIGPAVFSHCESLTSVIIPDSVTSIGDDAFSNCGSLTSVTIPDSVTTIGYRAFYYCNALTSVTIGNGITTIRDRAFYYCDSLTSITIPNSVTFINDGAFKWCDNLKKVYYGGTKETKDSIIISDDNDSLLSATWYYVFKDTPSTHWAIDNIIYCYQKGIMSGVGDGTNFNPSGTMTRAALVSMLYRLENSPTVSGESGFNDVAKNSWYEDAIIWASQNGIVSGKGDGRFAPTEALTRASFVSILYRYAEYCGEDVSARADLSAFADEANVPTWARANIEWAVAKGLLSGSTKNGALYINPTGIANRAQGATLLQKFCEM